MKTKWIIMGAGLGSLLFVAGGFAMWFTVATFTNVKALAQSKADRVQAMTNLTCVQAARGLLSSDAWISNPPRENFKTLKEACSTESKSGDALGEEALRMENGAPQTGA